MPYCMVLWTVMEIRLLFYIGVLVRVNGKGHFALRSFVSKGCPSGNEIMAFVFGGVCMYM